ncbi:hypothetical protein [Kitasatospora sp. GP82]|uniref:hypothetical protein n=1 Tax=Kitasatospora sp. GP82 TaxID=3035089 RepID=UPI0024745372|nr:hypothetical protein [Kitasatospora sp. GP82]
MTALTGAGTAGATPGHANPWKTTTMAGGSGQPSPKARAEGELWSPKGLNVGVWKTWNSDGHGGYSGQFQWVKSDNGVWVQMRITWESGRLEQKNMTFGKLYSYNGAYDVYMRACDSSGCGGWW